MKATQTIALGKGENYNMCPSSQANKIKKHSGAACTSKTISISNKTLVFWFTTTYVITRLMQIIRMEMCNFQNHKAMWFIILNEKPHIMLVLYF